MRISDGSSDVCSSDLRRSRVARVAASTSKITRWPWRSILNTDPCKASGARSYSRRSVSQRTTPSPVPGSYYLMPPCLERSEQSRVGTECAIKGGSRWAPSHKKKHKLYDEK